jgi:hypothetical protein
MVYGNAGAGVLIGLGAGFLVMAIIKLIKRWTLRTDYLKSKYLKLSK